MVARHWFMIISGTIAAKNTGAETPTKNSSRHPAVENVNLTKKAKTPGS